MNLKLLLNVLKAKSAADANHLSGWLGLVVSGGAGWLVSSGYIENVRAWVCQADMTDMGIVVAGIGAIASFVNTGTTKVLTPKGPKEQGLEIKYEYPNDKNH